MADVTVVEKLEKFMEDVGFGIYPLTALALDINPPPARLNQRAVSPELAESIKSNSPEPFDSENRKVINMMCNVKPKPDDDQKLFVSKKIPI